MTEGCVGDTENVATEQFPTPLRPVCALGNSRAPFVRFADIFPADGEIALKGRLSISPINRNLTESGGVWYDNHINLRGNGYEKMVFTGIGGGFAA